MIQTDPCVIPQSGASPVMMIVLAVGLVIAGTALARIRGGSRLALFVLLVAGAAIVVSRPGAAGADTSCIDTSATTTPSGATSTTVDSSTSSTSTPSSTSSSTSTSTSTSTTTTTIPDPSLTLRFNPSDADQYMWFCANAPDNTSSVCNSSPTKTLNNSSSGGNLEVVTVTNPGTLFNVTIKVDPTATYSSVKFGPGAGITCLQRTSGPEIGTSSGITLATSGLDRTGAGIPFWNYWFTRCSLDSGVTSAEFYAEFEVAP